MLLDPLADRVKKVGPRLASRYNMRAIRGVYFYWLPGIIRSLRTRGAHMSRQLGVIVIVLIASLVASASSAAGQAQVTGSIVGRVTDESGAVLPGVTVTTTSPALQVPQMVNVTNVQGDYRITPLPIGT